MPRKYKRKLGALILEINRTEKKFTVDCLRNFKGIRNQFVFPNVRDICTINFEQIEFILSNPVIHRGKHIFNDDIA
jgi:hypothetical protein